MANADQSLSLAFGNGEEVDHFDVQLSAQLVQLLSDQLYTSPTKAIEELVVNSYDADANECRIALLLDGPTETPDVVVEPNFEPASSADDGAAASDGDGEQVETDQEQQDLPPPNHSGLIAIFDDGDSMDESGLRQLWSIGASPKRNVTQATRRHGRKVIGKFGIGKLATYAVANRITYVVCHDGDVRQVLCQFSDFGTDVAPVTLTVHKVADLSSVLARPDMEVVLRRLGIDKKKLATGPKDSWTLCLLDQLKPKAARIRSGVMRYVLRSAMPLGTDFRIYLDNLQQESSKLEHTVLVEFEASAIEEKRLDRINDRFKIKMVRKADALVEPNEFPSGIIGRSIITQKPLEGGKSDLLGRSNGFFVKVRGRVINLDDPLFHNTARSHGAFSRFRGEYDIDDLHAELMASRESVGESRRRDIASFVVRELFEQARNQFENPPPPPKKEGHYTPEDRRTTVEEGLVERPLADVLLTSEGRPTGGDAEGGWFYIEPVESENKAALVENLYTKRTPYKFKRSSTGREQPLARFDPNSSEFDINESHQLVLAFDEPQHRELLDIIVTAEVMLEIYLAEAGVAPATINEILYKRDKLLRSLASDRIYSTASIAEMLRESADNDINLELALVAAARVLGFQVKHIGKTGEPDGLAILVGSAMDEKRITLEAKASIKTPSLGQMDYQTLARHREDKNASGVLLVAPRYPAQADDGSATAKNARGSMVSSWTVDLLAEVVEKSSRYRVTARQIYDIVTTKFAYPDVEAAVRELLSDDRDYRSLYVGIMAVLEEMFREKNAEGDVRDLSGIKAVLNIKSHPKATNNEVRRALADLAASSNGGMEIREDDTVLFLSSIDEIKRQVSSLTGNAGPPRTVGTFKHDPNQPHLPD